MKYFNESSHKKVIENKPCYEEFGYSIHDVALDILEKQNGKTWLDTANFSTGFIVRFEPRLLNNDTVAYPSYIYYWGKEITSKEKSFLDSIKTDIRVLEYMTCIGKDNLLLYTYYGQQLYIKIISPKAYQKLERKHKKRYYLLRIAIEKREDMNKK